MYSLIFYVQCLDMLGEENQGEKKKATTVKKITNSKQIGNYMIGKVMGKGALGTVYRPIDVVACDFVTVGEI